jgi:hypothetical protein
LMVASTSNVARGSDFDMRRPFDDTNLLCRDSCHVFTMIFASLICCLPLPRSFAGGC